MVTGSGVATGLRYQVILESMGQCLINEKGEYYTEHSKITRGIGIFFYILFIIPSLLLLYGINFDEEAFVGEDTFFIKIGLVLMIPSILILIRATQNFYFHRWTLSKNSLIIKRYSKTIEIPLEELKEVSLTMAPIDKKGYVILTSKCYLIRVPYVQAMGGIDFLMKLKVAADIPMIDEERLKKNVHAFKPITLKEDKKEYKSRKSMGMKVI